MPTTSTSQTVEPRRHGVHGDVVPVPPAAQQGPASGFFLVALVILALVVTAVWGLKAAFGQTTEGAHGDVSAGTTNSAPPDATPVRQPAIAGDVDGDGIADKVEILPGPRAAGGGEYDLVLRVDGSRAGELQLDLGRNMQSQHGMHPVDVSGSGFADVPIEVAVQGVQAHDELVALTAGGLGVVQVDGAVPLQLPTGHQGSTVSSWGCVDADGQPNKPGLVQRAVLSQQHGQWMLATTDYRITGSDAEQVGQHTKAVSHAEGTAWLKALQRCGAQHG